MFRLGVTGSIGSGKTSVARYLETKGGRLIVADDLAKSILQDSETIQAKLVKHFGATILQRNGTLDKSRLAELAFADLQNQKFLNNLIHPEVMSECRRRMEEAEKAGIQLFIIDAPLLYEAGMDGDLDAVLVVTASREKRLERVIERSGMGASDFARRDGLQLGEAEKLSRADFVIHNDASLEILYQRVDEFFEEVEKRF